MTRTSARRWWLLAGLCVAATPSLRSQELPASDISWSAEHLVESVQDSRLLALPWPAHELTPGEWQRSATLAWQSAGADLAEASGLLASVGATWAASDRFGWGGFVFYDRVDLAGDGSRELLRPTFGQTVPLALPAFAEFGAVRGDVRHWGAGGQVVWQRQKPRSRWRRTVIAGAYFERLDVERFRFAYELVTGADAGARGEIGWSASYSFVTPFVGIGWSHPLGRSWTIAPRFIAGQPLPRQAVADQLSGPGFEIEGEGRSAAMGDGYLGVGLAFEHLPTGLGIDLGSSLWYAATEGLTHEGLTDTMFVELSWMF